MDKIKLVDEVSFCLDCVKLDEAYKSFKDSLSSHKGLYVEAVATHSDKLINNRIYLRDEVARGANSWLIPFRKPVLTHHDDMVDPIGRVVSANYVDTISDLGPDFQRFRSFTNSSAKDLYVSFLVDKYLLKPDYNGTGHIKVGLDITDKTSIEKIMDERYMTMSIGFDSDHMFCSECNSDWRAGDMCDHMPGSDVDGRKVFSIMGKMRYQELSFVNKPADEGAVVISKGQGGSSPINVIPYVADSAQDKVSKFKDYNVEDFSMFKDFLDAMSNGSKLKMEEFFACEDFNSFEFYSSLGLPDNVRLSKEDFEALPKNVFSGPGQSLPLVDNAHFEAIKEVMKKFEDTKEKEKAINKLYYRAKKLFLIPSAGDCVVDGFNITTPENVVNSFISIKDNQETNPFDNEEFKNQWDSRLRLLNIDSAVLDQKYQEYLTSKEAANAGEQADQDTTSDAVETETPAQEQPTDTQEENKIQKIYTMYNELNDEDKEEFMSMIDTTGKDMLDMNEKLVDASKEIGALKETISLLQQDAEKNNLYTTNLEDVVNGTKRAIVDTILDLKIYLKKPGTDFVSVSRDKMIEDLSNRTFESLVDTIKDLRQELLDEYGASSVQEPENGQDNSSGRNEEVKLTDRFEPVNFNEFSRFYFRR